MPKLNLEEEILSEHSKTQTMKLVHYIGNDKNKFDELMILFLGNNLRITQRSAWILSYIAQSHPYLIHPYFEKLIELLEKDVHDAVKRNIFRLLQYAEIPEELEGKILNICFDTIINRKEAVAIRAFAITVAHRICKNYPELVLELQGLINNHLDMEKPAFVSRAKKVLNKNI